MRRTNVSCVAEILENLDQCDHVGPINMVRSRNHGIAAAVPVMFTESTAPVLFLLVEARQIGQLESGNDHTTFGRFFAANPNVLDEVRTTFEAYNEGQLGSRQDLEPIDTLLNFETPIVFYAGDEDAINMIIEKNDLQKPARWQPGLEELRFG